MDIINCPWCGGPLETGVIHGDRYSIKWIPEEKDPGALLTWFARGIRLTRPFVENKVEALHCDRCRRLIIDTGDKPDSRNRKFWFRRG